jgi:hypothetical protein
MATIDNGSQKDIEEWLEVVSVCMSSTLKYLDSHELLCQRSSPSGTNSILIQDKQQSQSLLIDQISGPREGEGNEL